MGVEGKVTLVVGSATGMGRETVIRLVKGGATVIAFDILGDKLEELKSELSDAPGSMEPYAGDVTDKEKIKGCIGHIKDTYGTLDNLVYVAGALDMMTPAHAVDDELWDYIMDVNVNSAFRFVREALPLLKDHEGRSANIVIVSSLGGLVGSSSGTAYITSKHAVLGLARNLAWTYKENNIHTNAVNPGSFKTAIMDNQRLRWPDRPPLHPEGVPKYYKGGANVLNGGTMLGEPVEIANAIMFLLSDEAGFINGAEITVDGGWGSF
ncbi:MAG: SDR family oxidoreductase [Lachnospiraceae bacterium]|jgi:NAD(P)-dependent dehydrogenase (short-subunit alcohol dehydrogenase family)|nr:SDR family oxidoreductase [Lachnospiraceae bacterium]